MHAHIRVNYLTHVHTGYNRVNVWIRLICVTAMMEIHASFSAYGLKVAFLNYRISCHWESLECLCTQSAKFPSKELRPWVKFGHTRHSHSQTINRPHLLVSSPDPTFSWAQDYTSLWIQKERLRYYAKSPTTIRRMHFSQYQALCIPVDYCIWSIVYKGTWCKYSTKHFQLIKTVG